MLITPEYREQNRLHHERDPSYGAGHTQIIQVAKMIWETGIKDVLDYGCGKGALARLYKPYFPIQEYDPAIPGKDNSPEPAEMVICRDVLEHIEPECIDDVLADLERCVNRFGYFVIGLSPSSDILPDGRNAHILQRPPEWWYKKLEKRFDILQFQVADVICCKKGQMGYYITKECEVYVMRKKALNA